MLPPMVCVCAAFTDGFASTVPPFAMLPASVEPLRRFTPSVEPAATLIWGDVMLPLAPLPICSVPTFTFVAPAYVFAPVSVVVPPPFFVTVPLPLIALETVTASLRLKTRAPLSITAPPPSVPAVAPAPIWSVPALIVVAPA